MNLRFLIGMVAALLLGPVFIIMGIADYAQTKKLLADGRVVPGTVAGTRTAHGRRSTSYHLVVTYKPTEAGAPLRKDFRVPHATYESASVGSQVPVRFLPDDPKVSMIGDTAESKAAQIAIGSAVFLFGAVLFWRHRRKFRKGA